MSRSELHLKYRPMTWGQVFGQDDIVKSLKGLTETGETHAFLFTGESGCGKTTLARLCASEIGIDEKNIIEVDAATTSGVEAWREITSTLEYAPIGGGKRAIIIDEAHGLSPASWQSLLKDIEEPPEHQYWFICTTENQKVPKTIKTRCVCYTVKPLSLDSLLDLLSFVIEMELEGDIDHAPDEDIVHLVAENSNGSPREALTQLAQVWDCEAVDEAAAVLEAPGKSKEVIDLCRELLNKKTSWKSLMKCIEAMGTFEPEGVRIVVFNYISAVAMKAKGSDVSRYLEMMDAFSESFHGQRGKAPIVLAVGRAFLS